MGSRASLLATLTIDTFTWSKSMNRRSFLRSAGVTLAALATGQDLWESQSARAAGQSLSGSRPNIVFILADDLAYKDLSAYGQKARQTPHLDRLALGGVRFGHAYAGASMCAPSRAVLMTGLHLGHCRIRHNASVRGGQDYLLDEDVTVAEFLKRAGYRTGMVGKWGIGLPGTPGVPHLQGFDLAYGFYDQQRAHGYYPEYMMRNGKKDPLPENHGFNMRRMYTYDRTPIAKLAPETLNTYDENGRLLPDGVPDPRQAANSQDLIHAEALKFIRQSKDQPFFLYYATQIPHGPIITKELGQFKDKPWDIKHKEWAAMIDHLDRHVGELVTCLEENGLLDNTIIFFASDNGYEPSYLNNKRYEDDPVFHYKGPWPGGKFSNREGGLRVPFFVYWKGKLAPRQSNHITAFWDFLPTAADLAGTTVTHEIDGISIVPELEGRSDRQRRHEYLYWENDNTRHAQSVRMDQWHAFRRHPEKPMELYDIVKDPECKHDLASQKPDVVERIARIMKEAHTPSEWFIEPGEIPESIRAKRERAKRYPMPQGRRANGI